MTPATVIVAGGAAAAMWLWCVSITRAAKRADLISRREARLTALATQAQFHRHQAVQHRRDLDDLLAEHFAAEMIAMRLREDREVAQLDALYEAPCANVIPISRGRRNQSRPDTGNAA